VVCRHRYLICIIIPYTLSITKQYNFKTELEKEPQTVLTDKTSKTSHKTELKTELKNRIKIKRKTELQNRYLKQKNQNRTRVKTLVNELGYQSGRLNLSHNTHTHLRHTSAKGLYRTLRFSLCMC